MTDLVKQLEALAADWDVTGHHKAAADLKAVLKAHAAPPAAAETCPLLLITRVGFIRCGRPLANGGRVCAPCAEVARAG